MLTITIETNEQFDERTLSFVEAKKQTLQLEHSLVSISKWESKWHKPFLVKSEKTNEEMLDYIRCMVLNKNFDPDILSFLSNENITQINDYINDPMTATTFSDIGQKGKNKEIKTSEVIYAQMITLGVPPEYQKWHINRLITLLRVCDLKNQPEKKMSKREIMNRNAALNAARRNQLNSKG